MCPVAVLTVVIWSLASFVLRGTLAASLRGGTSIYGPLSAPIVLLIWLVCPGHRGPHRCRPERGDPDAVAGRGTALPAARRGSTAGAKEARCSAGPAGWSDGGGFGRHATRGSWPPAVHELRAEAAARPWLLRRRVRGRWRSRGGRHTELRATPATAEEELAQSLQGLGDGANLKRSARSDNVSARAAGETSRSTPMRV